MVVCSVVFVMLPIFLIVSANMLLCYIAYQSTTQCTAQNSARWKADVVPLNSKTIVLSKPIRRRKFKGLLMTCLLSGVFTVSWLTYIVYLVTNFVIPGEHAWLYLISKCFIAVSSFVNPILYTLTNRRFGNHVKGILMRVFKIMYNKNIQSESVIRQKASYKKHPTDDMTSNTGTIKLLV